MTYKQFIIILTVWIAAVAVIFITPARSAEIGLVQTKGTVTCEEAKQDLMAVSARLNHLKDEFQAETDPSLRFIIQEEAKAVARTGKTIVVWMKENCRVS